MSRVSGTGKAAGEPQDVGSGKWAVGTPKEPACGGTPAFSPHDAGPSAERQYSFRDTKLHYFCLSAEAAFPAKRTLAAQAANAGRRASVRFRKSLPDTHGKTESGAFRKTPFQHRPCRGRTTRAAYPEQRRRGSLPALSLPRSNTLPASAEPRPQSSAPTRRCWNRQERAWA